MMKQTFTLALVLLSSTLLSAQAPVTNDIVYMTGGVELSTAENLKISADRVEFNRQTGEMVLFGTVVVRQELRPAVQPVSDPQQVMMRLRGHFTISIGEVTLQGEEADINGLTGEMTLRGNVKATSSRWAVKTNIQ